MRTGKFFEINVSKNGKHLFATDSSIRSYGDDGIVALLELFAQKFPYAEGYEVSVTNWFCTSSHTFPDPVTELLKNWDRSVARPKIQVEETLTK